MRVIDILDANRFWEAQETDILPLPLVAIALGIGRNRMSKIPVQRFMVDKRAYYKKCDILDWALSTDGKKLLNELKDKNSKIKKITQARTKAYEQIATRHVSHYRPKGKKETRKERFKRLCSEWGTDWSGHSMTGIEIQLHTCNDDEKLKELISIAWTIREQFVSLRMGLPSGISLKNWWFAKDVNAALEARKEKNRKEIKSEMKFLQDDIDSFKKSISNDAQEITPNNKIWLQTKQDELNWLKNELNALG